VGAIKHLLRTHLHAAVGYLGEECREKNVIGGGKRERRERKKKEKKRKKNRLSNVG